MLDFLANGLVLVGICLLIGALIPVGQLLRQIPSGAVRRSWFMMSGLIVVFVVGYAGYIFVFWGRHTDWLAFIVPVIFFLGAGFVWGVAALSHQTASNIRRVTLLEKENITDPLLGIFNRRYLDRRLDEELSRAHRYGMPLSVLLLDIDHFKWINDTYGHHIGDQTLNYLGKLIRHAIRESDIAARYGGDEVLIIAPNTTAESAATLAERIRKHVEPHPLVLNSEPGQRQEIHITVSIGVAALSPEGYERQQLFENADEALYRAKQEGRNRVISYRVGIPSGV